MSRQFSTDFGNRLAQARIRVVDESKEFNNALSNLKESMRVLEDQIRQLENQCHKSSRILYYLLENEKIEEFERFKQYHKELQAIDQLEQDIIAEEDSKVDRNMELLKRCSESLGRTERRFTVLLKRRPTIIKLKIILGRIEEVLNTIADEVSVQRIQTENASDETDGGSTAVEMVERKISSEVNGGSAMETVEDFSTDGKIRVTMVKEQRSSIDSPASISEEKLEEVKKSSQALDLREGVAKLTLLYQELDEIFGELEIAKNEFLEL